MDTLSTFSILGVQFSTIVRLAQINNVRNRCFSVKSSYWCIPVCSLRTPAGLDGLADFNVENWERDGRGGSSDSVYTRSVVTVTDACSDTAQRRSQ